MYAYIQGTLSHKSPTKVYVETGGVGFALHITLHTYSKIETLDETRLYTYMHVKEDDIQIYGFADEEEKGLFIQLLSVSGIGPNTARIILSSMTPVEVRTAIVTENDLAFKKVKGVGPKTAKRVILDLKDKVGPLNSTPAPEPSKSTGDISTQAIEALSALGFQKKRVEKVLSTLDFSKGDSVENIIKQALRKLT